MLTALTATQPQPISANSPDSANWRTVIQNKIEDLRNHLFATLEALRDKEAPMDIERAKTISTVANSIIESAKVECKYIEVMGGNGTGFVPSLPASDRQRLTNGRPS
jgi:hypothetical protein